ncbi:LuxR C-terminal-related transcriptional regulator [Streptomyces sp. NBC_00151]|uniref:LuxR C-terminal-related transcriptional regulator n=1 Tax=Streptomyces sp. NBC_00151 TaxID=2975669 RepID=UPI002DDAFF18|nr:LuxR C-terminal-related transcriptional regulator [Streptomyces sp. NBC_00151]WRZ40376.1 LuxR C-terminal-related transcriptional regulator [Streptomyces sp. NBC_00151]
MIEVRGERWSGKSTLLARLSRQAAESGWTVAAGSGVAPSLSGVPFGLFVDALDDVLALRTEPGRQDDWPEEQMILLSGVFPTLARAVPHGMSVDPVGRYQAFRAVRKLLESLGTAGGLLLVLDDVHWADEASVQLLTYLLVNPPAGAVAIALAHRPRQADHTLQGLLNQAVLEGRVHRMSPPRMSEEAAIALLPQDLSRAQCELMLAESGYVPGLLKAFAATRAVFGGPDRAPLTLPLDVLTECLRDFGALSELGRLVVQAAAVLGETFDPDVLREVAQIGDEQLHTAIDELMREDLLRTDRFSRRLQFSSPLLRAAAYQSAGPGWRLGAHDRAARRLARRGSGPVELARHLSHSAVIGDDDGVGVLRAAAAEHLWSDPGQAAIWARTALDLCERSHDTGRERLLLAGAMILCGRFHDGLAMVEALPDSLVDACAVRVEVARLRDMALRFLGCEEEAREQLDTVLAATDVGCKEHHALLLGTAFAGALSAGRPWPDDEIIELLDAAGALPEAARGWVYALAASAASAAGALERARTLAAVAAQLLDEAGDDEVVRHLDGLLRLARTETGLGHPAAARAHQERGMRIAESRRLAVFVARFAMEIATSQVRDGELPDAARHAAAAEWSAATTDSGPLLEEARALHGRLAPVQDRHPVRVPVQRERNGTGEETGEAHGPAEVRPVRTELSALSKRELEIAVLVSGGRTNQQIARSLAVSHKTVETHLGRIFKKLIVSSRAEVATMVGRSNGSGQRFSADRRNGPALYAG